ncbi:MAG: TasA family protein, partial [Eubacterium sp.]
MTKKKKGALLISALALIAVIVVGGTLAYFTSQDTAKNVFTLGKVSGEITETSTPDPDNNIKGGRPTEDGIEYDRVLPGDQLSKEPVVRLKAGSEDAYVRVKLTVENTDAK